MYAKRPEALARGVHVRPEIVNGERDVVPPDGSDVGQLLVRDCDALAADVGDSARQVCGVPQHDGVNDQVQPGRGPLICGGGIIDAGLRLRWSQPRMKAILQE